MLTGAAGARRVLVVEDHDLLRAHVKVMLEAAGYDVETAGDGLAALAALAARRPDVMVLDLRMPGLDGMATLEGVRKRPEWNGVAILVASAASEADQRLALAKGAQGLVPKPIEAAALLQQLARTLI